MAFGAHMRELRRRITISVLVITACAIGGYFLADWVLLVLARPLEGLRAEGRTVDLNFTHVTQAFNVKMTIGLIVGLIISAPVWLYETLAFFIPGLNRRERRYLFGFIAASIPLFLLGCVVGWLILPRIITIFVGIAPAETTQWLTAQEYFFFSFKLVLAVGAAFLLPVVLVLLNIAEVISGVSILKGWRWATVLIAVFAAMMTPAGELISMFALMIPVLALYLGAGLVAFIIDTVRQKRRAKEGLATA